MTNVDRQAEALERLIAGVGEADDELRPLAALAADVRRSLEPQPSDSARGRVWRRLLPQLRTSMAARPRQPIRILRPAFALAAAALAVVLTLGTTAAYASEAALPGDALYPVKRGLETARLVVSTRAGKDSLIVTFAGRRLSEIEDLAAEGRWGDLEEALTTYPQTVDGLDGLEPGTVEDQLGHHLEVLQSVLEEAPEAAQPGLTRALERAARGQLEAESRRHKKERGQGNPEDGTTPGLPQDPGRPDRTPGPGSMPPGLEKKLTPTP